TASQESTTEAQLRQQGGVTQGELLRQEQEAGVVPVTQISPRRSLISGGGGGGGAVAAVGREPVGTAAAGGGQLQQRDTLMDERPPEETPHARGPGLIGMEDMGPQQHPLGGGGAELDMEAAVGRSHSPPRVAQQQPAQPVETQQQVEQVPGAAQADAVMEEAGQDDAGEAGT
ncbi:hypothetical protein B0A55_13762, partial [Friedmanniomyces simplex]